MSPSQPILSVSHVMLCILIFSPSQMAKRPVSAIGNRRPISEFARMAAAMGNNPFRFKVSQRKIFYASGSTNIKT